MIKVDDERTVLRYIICLRRLRMHQKNKGLHGRWQIKELDTRFGLRWIFYRGPISALTTMTRTERPRPDLSSKDFSHMYDSRKFRLRRNFRPQPRSRSTTITPHTSFSDRN